MPRRWFIATQIFAALMLCYFVLIPLIWTLAAHGDYLLTDDDTCGRVIEVQPYPSRHLYVYHMETTRGWPCYVYVSKCRDASEAVFLAMQQAERETEQRERAEFIERSQREWRERGIIK